MSASILPQLQTAIAELASQENSLVDQLAVIQERRQGLQTVIQMFDTPASSNGSVAAVPADAAETVVASSPPADTPAADAAPTETPAAAPKAKRGRKPKSKTAATPSQKTVAAAPKTTQKTTRKTRSGRSPNWSRYIQEPFKKTPLPDLVANIVKSQPDQAFKIADVMEAIFKSDIPKTTFLKARNRVSNILSAGARNKEWHRGRGGRYSLSEQAVAS